MLGDVADRQLSWDLLASCPAMPAMLFAGKVWSLGRDISTKAEVLSALRSLRLMALLVRFPSELRGFTENNDGQW